jgi:hypothetical protein
MMIGTFVLHFKYLILIILGKNGFYQEFFSSSTKYIATGRANR